MIMIATHIRLTQSNFTMRMSFDKKLEYVKYSFCYLVAITEDLRQGLKTARSCGFKTFKDGPYKKFRYL